MFASIRLPSTMSIILLMIDIHIDFFLSHLSTGCALPNASPTAINGKPSPREYTMRRIAPLPAVCEFAAISSIAPITGRVHDPIPTEKTAPINAERKYPTLPQNGRLKCVSKFSFGIFNAASK